MVPVAFFVSYQFPSKETGFKNKIEVRFLEGF